MTKLLTALLREGIAKKQNEYSKKAKEETPAMRGGSVGVQLEDGTIHGGCMRKHWLRMHGVQAPVDLNTSVMFSAGITNEDSVVEDLLATGEVDVKREEEYPVKGEVGGVPVSGRPDIVVFPKGEDKPSYFIECKNISSVWTHSAVVAQASPRSDHIVQAGFYSYMLGKQLGGDPLPAKLLYSSGVNFALPFNQSKHYEGRTTIAKMFDNGKPKDAIPGRWCYDLSWEDGKMSVVPEGSGEEFRMETLITTGGYEKYMTTLAGLWKNQNGELPPPPSSAGVAPSNKGVKTYACSYCEFKNICASDDISDLTMLLDACKMEVNHLKKQMGSEERREIL